MIYQPSSLIVKKQTTSADYFLDSNVILYLLDQDARKRSIAEDLLRNGPFVSSQVLIEVGNVCRRVFKYSKEEVLRLWTDLLIDCTCIPVDGTTITEGIRLIERNKFQLFDGIIVASALQSDAKILYSEDMHHNQLIDRKLRIINPFLI